MSAHMWANFLQQMVMESAEHIYVRSAHAGNDKFKIKPSVTYVGQLAFEDIDLGEPSVLW